MPGVLPQRSLSFLAPRGCALLLMLLAVALTTQAEEPASQAPRLREGTLLDQQAGTFQIRGDRAIFYPDHRTEGLVGLENLNLARIYQTVSESPDELHWHVSGLVTEYNGANYLLVTRAVRKTPAVPANRPVAPRSAETGL